MTRPLLFSSAALATGCLAAAFGLAGASWLVLVLLSFGVLWIVAISLRLSWASSVGLFGVYGFAAAGFWLQLSTPLLLAASLAGLAAWDLAAFDHRLGRAAPGDDVKGLERSHLLRLVGLAGAGLVLSLAALYLPARISFGWALLLVVLGMWGVGRLVGWMGRG